MITAENRNGTLLTSALGYLANGLPITICRDKKPLGIGWTATRNGEEWERKTWTADEVERAFLVCGALNVGIRLGPDGDLIDIEADSDEEEQNFQELFAGVEIPPTPTFKSKRGVHRLFRWHEALAVTGKAVVHYKELGIRIGANGKGAHSCVPPSINDDGTCRTWITSLDECEPAELPPIVLRRIIEANMPAQAAPVVWRSTEPAQADVIERARKYLAAKPPAVEGSDGDNHTFAAACNLVLGFDLSPDQAWPILVEWNETCQPPWDERRLRRKLDEADKQPGERGSLLNAERNGRSSPAWSGKLGHGNKEPDTSKPNLLPPEGRTEAAADAEATITNAEVIGTGEDRQTVPLTMEQILERVRSRTDNWPRRVDEALFVHDPQHGVCWITSSAAAFGWLGTKAQTVYWRKGVGCATKDEVFHELRRTSRRYRAVENLPHEPILDGHFYACESVQPGNGDTLSQLLDRFSPAADIDRDLIQAALMTLFWGGPGGSRPAFVWTSDDGRGAGKTKGAERIGDVAGGVLHFAHNEAIGDIKARMLSPDALTKRVALLDNVKTLRFSWAELEALVTALEIGGKRMYVGEASRPNTITWFITLNGASLSTDMAQRSVIIKLKKPERSGTWEDDTKRFILENRSALIADIIGCLQAEPYELKRFTRWATWEAGVLSRLPEPSEAQAVIAERQGAVDVEEEEAGILEDFFAEQLKRLRYDAEREQVFVPSQVSARWHNWAANENAKTGAVSRIINQLCTEGRLKRLKQNKCNAWGKGFIWVGEKSDTNATVRTDLLERLAEQKAREQQQKNQNS